MGDRQAKGVNLIGVVKLLRGARKKKPVVRRLSPAAQLALDSFILPTSWYAFEVFEELLLATHEEVYGGTDETARELGRAYSRMMFQGAHKAYVHPGEPGRSLVGFERVWSSIFNFAGLTVKTGPGQALVQFSGYPATSRTHGQILVGVTEELLRLAGAGDIKVEVLAAPWLGTGEMRFDMRWVEKSS